MHFTPDELIDFAEGARPESAAPHLRSCVACRQQVAELRAAMSAAADVDVPEPSPLFWEHLSARVRESVAAEGKPGSEGRERGWASLWPLGPLWPLGSKSRWSWSATAVAGVVAATALAVYLTAPRDLNPLAPSTEVDATADVVLQPFGAADDPSLALVADLTGQLDPDALAETAWTQHTGAVDEVVANLTEDERVELRRLLQEELAKS